MIKEWVIKNICDGRKTALELLLEQRGIIKPDYVKEFLNRHFPEKSSFEI